MTYDDNTTIPTRNRRGRVVVLLLLIAVTALILGIFIKRGVFEKENTVGNSMGNIRNYGYATYQKGWIYYVAPTDDNIKSVGVFKSRIDGNSKKQLKPEDWKDNWNVMSLNVVGDYIYFITTEAKSTTSDNNEETVNSDSIDNRIYKMKIDGTELTLLNDNEFNDESYSIYVVNDKIYYIGSDLNIYSMDLNGENRVALGNKQTGFLGVNDKYILYNDYPETITEQTTNKDFITYIMDLDGNNIRTVNGKKLTSACMIDDYIYYTNENKYLCKVKVDGSDDQVLVEKATYNLTSSKNYLYFFTYKDEANKDFTVCLTRVSPSGNNLNIIKELDKYSQFLNIVKESAFYMDSVENHGYIYLYNHNDGKKYELYSVDYNNITDSSSGTTSILNTVNN